MQKQPHCCWFAKGCGGEGYRLFCHTYNQSNVRMLSRDLVVFPWLVPMLSKIPEVGLGFSRSYWSHLAWIVYSERDAQELSFEILFSLHDQMSDKTRNPPCFHDNRSETFSDLPIPCQLICWLHRVSLLHCYELLQIPEVWCCWYHKILLIQYLINNSWAYQLHAFCTHKW